MIEGLLLTFFIFIVPIFNKNIDYSESIIFFSVPIILNIVVLINQKYYSRLTKKQIISQIILIVLGLPSFFFSISIGQSYYGLFIFLNIILAINLSLILIEPKDFIKWLIRFSTLYSIILISNKLHILNLSNKPLGDNFIMQFWGHSYFADFLIISIPSMIFSATNPLILTINIVALILTNSRSALIGVILAILLLKTKTKIIKNSLLILLFLFSLILWTKVIQGKIPQKNISGNRTDYWHQAIKGFSDHPLTGNGFNTFNIISNKYRSQSVETASSAHNSILSLLSDNGIFFTIFILFIIINRLKINFHQNNLFFAIFSGLILSSFFDPVFSSPGITILAFYLLLQTKEKIDTNKQTEKPRIQFVFLFLLTLLILIHTISKSLSDYYFVYQKNYQKSAIFDPMNINPRIQLVNIFEPKSSEWQKNIQIAQILNPQETKLFQSIIESQGTSLSIPYFYKIFTNDPKGNCNDYVKLANYYRNHQEFENLEKILQLISTNFNENEFPDYCAISIARINYNLALETYKNNSQKAIIYLERCIKLSPTLSHYQIELANLYWFLGENEKAKEIVLSCTTKQESRVHCQHYLDQHQNRDFDLPGKQDVKTFINNYNREYNVPTR